MFCPHTFEEICVIFLDKPMFTVSLKPEMAVEKEGRQFGLVGW